jgi:hypothetical protein
LPGCGQRTRSIGGGDDDETRLLQVVPDQAGDFQLVVNHQNRAHQMRLSAPLRRGRLTLVLVGSIVHFPETPFDVLMTRSPVAAAWSPRPSMPERREDEEEEQQGEDPEEREETKAPEASVPPSSIDHYGRRTVPGTGCGGAESSAFEAVLVGDIDGHSYEHHC